MAPLFIVEPAEVSRLLDQHSWRGSISIPALILTSVIFLSLLFVLLPCGCCGEKKDAMKKGQQKSGKKGEVNAKTKDAKEAEEGEEEEETDEPRKKGQTPKKQTKKKGGKKGSKKKAGKEKKAVVVKKKKKEEPVEEVTKEDSAMAQTNINIAALDETVAPSVRTIKDPTKCALKAKRKGKPKLGDATMLDVTTVPSVVSTKAKRKTFVAGASGISGKPRTEKDQSTIPKEGGNEYIEMGATKMAISGATRTEASGQERVEGVGGSMFIKGRTRFNRTQTKVADPTERSGK